MAQVRGSFIRLPRARALVGLAAATLVAATAVAQESTPGLRAAIDYGAGLRTGSDDPAATADLALRIDSETRTQKLSFGMGAAFQASLDGEDGAGTLPFATLAYSRDNGAALIDLTASFNRSDVSKLVSLAELDPDFTGTDLIVDTGTRDVLRAGLSITIGQNAPWGLDASAQYSDRSYNDTLSPDLSDQQTSSLEAGLRFSPTRTSSARLYVRGATSKTDDAENFESNDTSVGLSLSHSFTPTLSLSGSISNDRLERSEDVGATRVVTVEDGVGASLALTVIRPAMNYNLSVSRVITSTGPLHRVSFGQEFQRPRDVLLSYNVGLSRFASGEQGVTADVNYVQPFKRGSMVLAASRSARTSDDAEDSITTRVSARYSRDLTAISSLSANFALAGVEAVGTGTDRTSADFGVTYRRKLTRDVDLSTGVKHIVRDSSNSDRETENTFFLNLEGTFAFRP